MPHITNTVDFDSQNRLFVDQMQWTRTSTPATYRAKKYITAELNQYYVSEPKYSIFKSQYKYSEHFIKTIACNSGIRTYATALPGVRTRQWDLPFYVPSPEVHAAWTCFPLPTVCSWSEWRHCWRTWRPTRSTYRDSRPHSFYKQTTITHLTIIELTMCVETDS